MEFEKDKAYGLSNQTFFYNGDVFYDFEADIVTELPDGVKRKPQYDKYCKMIFLEAEKKKQIKEGTYELPKEKEMVKLYTRSGGITYGIVWADEIISSDGYYHKVKDEVYEIINPNEEQAKALTELYNAHDLYKFIDNQIYDLRNRQNMASRAIKDIRVEVDKIFGILNKDEFIDCFRNYLSPEIQNEIVEKGYKISFSSNSNYAKSGNFYIERTVIFPDKYGLNLEYDNEENEYILNCASYEAQKAAMKHIEENSKDLYLVVCPSKELQVAYYNKEDLLLVETYTFVPKELTKQEAKSLAEEFCSHAF